MSDDREAPGNADRASDADLDALLRELSSRTGRGGAPSARGRLAQCLIMVPCSVIMPRFRACRFPARLKQ